MTDTNSKMYEEEFDDDKVSQYEHYRFEVDKGQGPLRIDKYLMNRIENATRNKIQQAAKDGNVLVNDEPVKANYRGKPLDIIRNDCEHQQHEDYMMTETTRTES